MYLVNHDDLEMPINAPENSEHQKWNTLQEIILQQSLGFLKILVSWCREDMHPGCSTTKRITYKTKKNLIVGILHNPTNSKMNIMNETIKPRLLFPEEEERYAYKYDTIFSNGTVSLT